MYQPAPLRLGPSIPMTRQEDMAGPRRLLEFARLARQAGDAETAVSHYREAQFLAPDDPDVVLEYAVCLMELGRYRAAVESLERGVRRHPDSPALRFRLALAWRDLADPGKAMQQLRRCLDLDPDDRLGAAAELARLSSPAASLPEAYLRELFDQYADEFDQNLIKDLEYRAPEVLRQAVDRCWRAPAAGADVLDLGCGTGLGGAAFRDLARRLHGVDLSAGMVAKARARGIYDALAVGEAVASLQAAAPAAWDLVIAADVLVYLGDLHPLFAATARALRPGGAFALTVEAGDDDVPRLKPSRRFGHSPGYLEATAAAAGLAPALLEPTSVRTERGEPVPSYVAVLMKRA